MLEIRSLLGQVIQNSRPLSVTDLYVCIATTFYCSYKYRVKFLLQLENHLAVLRTAAIGRKH